jgi:hypothetical protein
MSPAELSSHTLPVVLFCDLLLFYGFGFRLERQEGKSSHSTNPPLSPPFMSSGL